MRTLVVVIAERFKRANPISEISPEVHLDLVLRVVSPT